MTTMLERAARAAGDIQVGVDEGGEAVFAGPHVGLALARAVLMAVREPGDAMIEEGGKLALSWRDVDGVPGCKKIFTAMIDAILEGK